MLKYCSFLFVFFLGGIVYGTEKSLLFFTLYRCQGYQSSSVFVLYVNVLFVDIAKFAVNLFTFLHLFS